MSLIWIIIGLLLLLLRAAPLDSTSYGQSCSSSSEGVERCSPETAGGRYSLPADGDVITVVVNNGPLSPEYQKGYAINVGPDGTVTIVESIPDSESIIRTESIGVDDVQQLLTTLEQCQFYFLPQIDEFDDSALPVGGPVSVIRVHLANGDWGVAADTLTGEDLTRFESCQQAFSEQFDVQPPD
jgi:hypothetical protein